VCSSDLQWKKGLADWGQSPERIQRFRDAVDLAIYTPGKIVTPSKELDKKDERAGVIALAAKEYDDNPRKMQHVSRDSYINVSLREKGLAVLSADEVKNMKGGH
jgi:hypothetical protein